MAISAPIQSIIGNSGGYNNTIAKTLTGVVAGNFISIGIVAGEGRTVASIVSNNSDTIVSSGTPIETTGDRKNWQYYIASAVGGSTTITVTFGAGEFEDAILCLVEFSGLENSSTLDQYASNSDGVGSFVQNHPTGTTGATTQANELVIAWSGSSGSSDPTFAVPSGYSGFLAGYGFDIFTYGAWAYKIVSVTGTQTATFTTTGYVTGQGNIATYKASTSSPILVNALLVIGN